MYISVGQCMAVWANVGQCGALNDSDWQFGVTVVIVGHVAMPVWK